MIPTDVDRLISALPESSREQLDFLLAEEARLERWRAAPEVYAQEFLNVIWWERQIEIAYSVLRNRRTVIYSGHAVGKSNALAGIAMWSFDCFTPSITLTTAPTWSSINDVLWGEIRSQRPAAARGYFSGIRLYDQAHHYLKGHNAESGASFQGRHEGRVLLVIDEATGIPLYIWEAADSMMTSPECRMIVSGNPTETSGMYYELREDPAYNVIHISCLEHPNILAELEGRSPPFPKAVSLLWVKERLDKHAQTTTTPTADSFEFPKGSGVWYDPDDEFRSRVLGLFPKQAAHAIWSDSWILEARRRELKWSESDPIELGVDVARFGSDLSVLYARRGPVVLESRQYARQDTMETTGRVVEFVKELSEIHSVEPKDVLIKVDDVGLGGAVVDRLKELDYTVFAVIAGSEAMEPELYVNRRAELWFTTALRARDLRIDLSRLPDESFRVLSAELKAVRYKIKSDRQRQVESKDDYKKRVGRSPDHADSLNLAFATGRSVKLGFA